MFSFFFLHQPHPFSARRPSHPCHLTAIQIFNVSTINASVSCGTTSCDSLGISFLQRSLTLSHARPFGFPTSRAVMSDSHFSKTRALQSPHATLSTLASVQCHPNPLSLMPCMTPTLCHCRLAQPAPRRDAPYVARLSLGQSISLAIASVTPGKSPFAVSCAARTSPASKPSFSGAETSFLNRRG
jgi:hypothetical protein